MAYLLVAALMLFCPVVSALAQTTITFGSSGISIGINVGTYPRLTQVPGYPIYYSPNGTSNYFFYDGMYWIYTNDNWYASSWYNGPWDAVGPEEIPLAILNVPVRYYRSPPAYFHGFSANAAPRWSEHWGNDWQQHRVGWDQWNPRSAPPVAPLPTYQQKYSGNRYPRAADQQRVIQSKNYRYQPRETVTQRHYTSSQNNQTLPQNSGQQNKGQQNKGQQNRNQQRAR